MGTGRKREAKVGSNPAGVTAARAKVKGRSKASAKIVLVPFTPKRRPEAGVKKTFQPTLSKGSKISHIVDPNDTFKPVDGGDNDWEDQGVYVPFEIKSNPAPNNSNEYMRQWLDRQGEFLDEIIAREASPETLRCSQCSSESDQCLWRCKDCCDRSLRCKGCFASEHISNPFHRAEVWNKHHFSPTWMWKAGIYVNLCHTRSCVPRSQPGNPEANLEENRGSQAWVDNDDFTHGASPKSRYLDGRKVLVVVHLNGVHHLPFHFCQCNNAKPHDLQLIEHGFYPSTFKDVRTVFTHALLDDYLLDVLECHTSTHHYYSKLCRLTNKPFPHTVPNRTRELRRAGRQWRRLKDLKRNGFAHKDRPPGKGEMALFCAACPQPGINLPDDWEQDDEAWKYIRSFVADGNFKCIHRTQKSEDDIWLSKGESYMTERKKYAQHISSTPETKQIPTCNEHRAVADKSKLQKGCDVTGIGAMACMRHGCFVPGSVVDFQRGERQKNMDYSLTESIELTCPDGINKIILAYDINCQYSVHLRKRILEGEYLRIRDDIVLVYGIGLFHVHGHQASCNARYSLTYIQGAGMSSGEILESLWAIVNEAGRTTSTMSLGHRAEVLDAVMGDSNWKKMINLVPNICKNWERSRLELLRAKEDFELLNETASKTQQKEWQAQLDGAQLRREQDVTAMDILDVTIEKPPTLSEIQNNLMKDEQTINSGLGITSWIATGIRIEENQKHVKTYVRNLPKRPTASQELELSKRRELLQKDINSFYETAKTLFPEIDFDELKCDQEPLESIEIDGEDVDAVPIDDETENPFSLSQNECEDVAIPLPSSFASPLPMSMEPIVDKELKLRVAEANDALEGVREDIGHKSFLYRSNIRLAEGKQQKTRGYAAVRNVNASMRFHIKVYNHARWALSRLGADPALMSYFKPISKEDTKAITAIYKPNARGERNKKVSWIWSMAEQGHEVNSQYLAEVYRVNWVRAKCRMERWKEEHHLLRSEMEWILNFFAYKSDQCKAWGLMNRKKTGYIAYARRQEEMWRLLGVQAEIMFGDTIKKHTPS
ncbi:hypothetical protein BKA70DRAFT_1497792 [Coprinopsis sp. MPI-PUGE-AT-0042]|nr:hypothetical protein BKA70DRAFT_1497792 [Coprinopsis sp. MPI-PUGE-AT-0042]